MSLMIAECMRSCGASRDRTRHICQRRRRRTALQGGRSRICTGGHLARQSFHMPQLTVAFPTAIGADFASSMLPPSSNFSCPATGLGPDELAGVAGGQGHRESCCRRRRCRCGDRQEDRCQPGAVAAGEFKSRYCSQLSLDSFRALHRFW